MNSLMENIARTAAVGLGATLAMDLWRFLLLKGLGVSSLDLVLLGRWVAYLFRGRVFHKPIAKSPRVNGELVVGWVSHYAIGVGFAGLMPLVSTGWLDSPALLPALAVGVATVLAPWFIMQPAMGLGIAASNLPTPNSVRILVGLGMLLSIVLSARAVLSRQYREHGAWMSRAYALGMGAGTQAIYASAVAHCCWRAADWLRARCGDGGGLADQSGSR